MGNLLDYLGKPDTSPLFLTGAGISLASGIPTFRGDDPDAVWAKDVLSLGTLAFFHKNPVKSWAWYLSRFDKCRSAEPNPAHLALAEIEAKLAARGRPCNIVTQNVDGLHLKAGSKTVHEVHGAARKVRCSSRNCVNGAPKGFLPWDDETFGRFRADVCQENLPRCPECGKLLRAHVLWFDEHYTDHEDYRISDVYRAVEDATVFVFVGTSFSVGITDMVLSSALDSGKPTFVIDPHLKEPPKAQYSFAQDTPPAVLLKARAEVLLPAVASALE